MTSKHRIRRAFVTIRDRQVHYRYAGAGPVVVLIGQSPTSSRTLDHQTLAFAEHFTAIAIDLPGLGRSTALSARPEVTDQAVALAEMLDAMEIAKVGFYGSHSGASIGLEFSRLYPHRCAMALLDGLPIYNDLERNLRLSTYFPEYVPTWDGLHLMWLWYRYREQNVFWPWNIRGKGARGPVDMPAPEKLHNGVSDILEVGNGYIAPYAAVFRYRAEDAIPHLRTPVHFLAYPDDSLLPSLRHLPNLPSCCHLTEMPLDKAKGVKREVELMLGAGDWGTPVLIHDARTRDNGTSLDYVEVTGGQLALRRYGIGKGRPLVILPPMPGSVSQLGHLPEALARDREVVAIDLPGCGDSDLLEGVPIDIQAYAKQLAIAIGSLFEEPVDLYARDGGCAIAIALKKRFASGLRKVILDNPPALHPAERENIAARYAEPIVLDWDGAHLIRLWHATRDQELYWPWYERTRNAVRHENEPEIDPLDLTVEVHAYLKNHTSYADTWRAVLTYPIFESLRDEDADMTVGGDRDGRFLRLARLAAGAGFIVLPKEVSSRSAAIIKALDGG